MEIQYPLLFTSLLLSASLIFILIEAWKRFQPSNNLKVLPPSPLKLPLIGHLLQLTGGPPHRVLRKLANKLGPIMYLQLGSVTTIVISSSQASKEVLHSQDPGFADRPDTIAGRILGYDFTDIVFSPYGEYWRHMRKICILEVLSAKNVRSFSLIRQEEVSRLIDSVHAFSGEPINLTEKIFGFTSRVLSRVVFGKERRDRAALLTMLKKMITKTAGFELADLFPSLEILSWSKYSLLMMRRQIDSILDAILDEHRLQHSGEFGGEDIVDVLLRMKERGELGFPITDKNIKAVIFDMFSAGSETSSTAFDWTFSELMRNPRVMAKAQAEIRQTFKGKNFIDENDIQSLNFLKLVIKESLRLHPPFPLILRACRQETQVNGYTIPLRARIIINIWAMGQDPEYWQEPASFWPERFEDSRIDFLGNSFEFIPFGAGRRICPGINFGLANVELPLARLLYHFDWTVPEGTDLNNIDMTEAEGLAVARKNALFLVPTTHNFT